MKKLLLFLTLTSLLFSAKTDIYFSNGIMTSPAQADYSTYAVLQGGVLSLYDSEADMKEYIHRFKYAYNSTHIGGLHDLVESMYQKLSIVDYLDKLKELYSKMKETAHSADLQAQVAKYTNSINSGYEVLVVAHSQGNLFASEAYRKLATTVTSHWEAIGVASPGMFEIKANAPSIAWDNDLVADLALNPFREQIQCNVRRVDWKVVSAGSDYEPDEIYLYGTNVGRRYGSFRGTEGLLEGLDFNVHSFDFYMGGNLTGLISGRVYTDIFDKINLVDTNAKKEILRVIDARLFVNGIISTGGDDNNTDNNDTGGGDNNNTGGDNPADFDFHAQCSDIEFPDPIPDELGETIDGILSSADDLAAGVVCPLIDGAVKAYNLANGGGVPGGF